MGMFERGKKQQNWCHEKWHSPASFELLYCILVIFRSLSNVADLLFIKCDVLRKGHFSHKGCIKVQANSQSACTRDLHSRADKQALLFI